MGSTSLELTRATHEEIERTQRAIIEELDYAPRNFKESVVQTNRISKYLDNIFEKRDKLIDLYADEDGTRKDEINAIGGTGTALFSTFYEKLRELKDYHRRFPGIMAEDPSEQVYFLDEEALPPFTGEERYGRCLDLHELYERFINLEEIKKIATQTESRYHKLLYIDFVQTIFYQFDDELSRKNAPYKQYLKDLLQYLVNFIERSQPLFELQALLKKLNDEFEAQWKNGEFKWNRKDSLASVPQPPSETDNHPKKRSRDQPKEPSTTSNSENENNPLYCKHCHKLFTKQSVYDHHLQGKKHISAVERDQAKAEKLNNPANFKEFYALEYKIHSLATEILLEQIDNTKTNIEKRQARSADELLRDEDEEEVEEVIIEEESESEDELEIKTTIENYPVGWDGKPIPYWLYKLHGLGVEYKCEICGNTSYFGRKAYEKHFQEWRHAHGMRCLGIPNSRHFHDITSINDALTLWEKIRKDSTTQVFRPDTEEEFEDAEGTVYIKKTYEDLKRQGILNG